VGWRATKFKESFTEFVENFFPSTIAKFTFRASPTIGKIWLAKS